jgi:hypothetical protein
VEFRIRIWLASVAPEYDSQWFEMSAMGAAYKYHHHGMGTYPGFVKVVSKPTSGVNNGYLFEGVGAAQVTDVRPFRQYSGVVFAYNTGDVRLWAPGKSSDEITHAYSSLIALGDGWGTWENITETVNRPMVCFGT